MNKKAYFYIDDTIWALRDITRIRPASMFDTPFFNMLKTAHEKYALKVQLNLFYRTDSFYGNDDFCLADVTDSYKSEWEGNSDWLKLAFHAKEEFPDYPHINATYDDLKAQYQAVENEVKRFAGEKTFTYATCAHWLPVSKEGVKALYDCGVRIMDCTVGYTFELEEYPELAVPGQDSRLINNRTPEARLRAMTPVPQDKFIPLCSYNNLSVEQYNETIGTLKYINDEETNMKFKCFGGLFTCINNLDMKGIEENIGKQLGNEYIGMVVHEQYFYKDYFNYQPDYAEKIYKMSEILASNGYEFFFVEDLVK